MVQHPESRQTSQAVAISRKVVVTLSVTAQHAGHQGCSRPNGVHDYGLVSKYVTALLGGQDQHLQHLLRDHPWRISPS